VPSAAESTTLRPASSILHIFNLERSRHSSLRPKARHLFGFVKKTELVNLNKFDLKISILDGIQNIVPYGVNSDLQNASSNLVDAYHWVTVVPYGFHQTIGKIGDFRFHD